jgi:hypothetical protein
MKTSTPTARTWLSIAALKALLDAVAADYDRALRR